MKNKATMRALIPHFILDKTSKGEASGSLPAATLFVDTSGITPPAQTLVGQGASSAEALANILDDIFNPLEQHGYGHGGFVASFAGDAFKALFPGQRALAPADPDGAKKSGC